MTVSAPALTQEIYNRRSDDGGSPVYVPPQRGLIVNNQTSTARSQANRQPSGALTAALAIGAPSAFQTDYTPYTTIPFSVSEKIYAFSDPPNNVQEMNNVDRYNDLERVRHFREMVNTLEALAPSSLPSATNTFAFQTPAREQTSHTATKDNVKQAEQPKRTLYNRMKNNAQSRVWKLWGNNR